MTQAGLERWPLVSQAGTLNRWASMPTGEEATKSTNKPYSVVKNMY